jgi:transcriptional regulator with XRE-family HTH domain
MGAQEFGQLVEAERLKRRWTRSKLAVTVGILEDGTALDATQIRRIIEGTRKLNRDVIGRLIAALGLDPAEAWEAALESADLKPPGLTVDMLRKLDLVASGSNELTARSVGQTALPVPAELQDAALLRRLGVANLERRRAERRRRLRLVPQVERRVA